MVSLLVVGHLGPANTALLAAARALDLDARLLPPEVARKRARRGDVVLGRVDVRRSLDGVEPGLETLERLERDGHRVLNRAAALRRAHDKLATWRALEAHAIAHPATAHVRPGGALPDLAPPVVVKPRFGSWGEDVVLCSSRRELARTLRALECRPWFARQGALVQELVPPSGRDLRIVVAGGAMVGAVERVAASGEWRTNVALGAERRPVVPPPEAAVLALAAAAAVGTDLVGVDLLPLDGGFTVLEVNGCVDFNAQYGLAGGDVFEEALAALLASVDQPLWTVADPLQAVVAIDPGRELVPVGPSTG